MYRHYQELFAEGERRARAVVPKLIADGFVVKGGKSFGINVRVLNVTAYGPRIGGLSLSFNGDVVKPRERGGMYVETLTIGPDGEIAYTDEPPYYGDVMRFDTYQELKDHLMFATGRGATPVADDDSSESDEEEDVEIAETGETAAAPPPPPADTGTPVPPLPPAVSGTPVPPIPPEMGIRELGAQLVELFQDEGPMMNESETRALGALLELMKTLGA